MLKLLLAAGVVYFIWKSKHPTTIGNQDSSQVVISSDDEARSNVVGGYPSTGCRIADLQAPIRQAGAPVSAMQVAQNQPSWWFERPGEYKYQEISVEDSSGIPANNFRGLGDNFGSRA